MKKFLLLMIVFFSFSYFMTNAQGSRQTDSLALVALFNSTNGLNWSKNFNWATDKPIDQWWGVILENNRVTELNLGTNNLTGKIPTEIGDLTYLSRLSLRFNPISGQLPIEITKLTNLIELGLTGTKISGSIPKDINKLSNLQLLALGDNQLSGEIPKEIGQLKALTALYIHTNKISGSIPAELGDLSNLMLLQIGNNSITGKIPKELSKLKNLISLILFDNKMEGNLPPELGNLKNLTYFYLNNLGLSGSIPPELGNLTELTYFGLNLNQLTGTIPKELGNLTKLDTLLFRDNKLTGTIPKELGNLTNIKALSFRNNNLTGTIPEEFKNLVNLTEFRCSNNNISGGLANLPKNNYDVIWIFGNAFNFDELLNPIEAADYQYSPQDSLGIPNDSLIVPVGANITLNVKEFGTDNDITYTWKKDGKVIEGIKTKSFNIPYTNESHSGYWQVSAIHPNIPNLILNSHTFKLIVDTNTDVEVFEPIGQGLSIFPNPTMDYISVNYDAINQVNESKVIIEIYDAKGIKIKSSTVGALNIVSLQHRIDISNLAPGLYFLKIGENVNKFVKY